MTAHELLANLRKQGFQLTPLPGDRLEVRPFSKLSEELREELRKQKAELLLLLEAVSWLRPKLSTPQRIASLVAEWVGTLDNPTGRSVDALMEARWALRIEAHEGKDGRLWWRLPQIMVQ